VVTKSVRVLTIAAIISGIIGVLTGNPKYMLNDLLGVAMAWWIGFDMIRDK